MSVRDLIPWGRSSGNQVPSVLRDGDRDPFLSLHREVNRLFDDVFRGVGSNLPSIVGASAFSGGWPSVEISDGEKEIKVTAEVPGLEEKDIEVLLDDGVLTLRGEKRPRRRTRTDSSPSASMAASSVASRSATRSRTTRSTRGSKTAC